MQIEKPGWTYGRFTGFGPVGAIRLSGWTRNHFAIHLKDLVVAEGANQQPVCWVITHIPTGLFAPCGFDSFLAAEQVARLVEDAHQVDLSLGELGLPSSEDWTEAIRSSFAAAIVSLHLDPIYVIQLDPIYVSGVSRED